MSEIKDQTGRDFVKESMFRYGREAIENRAVPRIEDGMKPVQRLLLWALRDFKTDNFIKSAKVTGHAVGTYSPHGEKAAYDALVKMVNERYAGIEGHGNYGSLTNDPAGARYTEARLSPLIKKICTDLPDVDIIPYEQNYDDTCKQPVYLPVGIPYILLNGTEGIAVGMSLQIPSFNFEEVCKSVLKFLKSGDLEAAAKQIKAPDGFDCTLVSTKKEVKELLDTGSGTLEYICKHRVEQVGRRQNLIIEGYCPNFSPTSFLGRCGKLQDDDVIEEARNESSDDNGTRIVVEFLDKEVYEKKLLPLLKKKVSYQLNVLFDRNGVLNPEMCSVGKIIREWTDVRRNQLRLTLESDLKGLAEKLGREQAKLKAALNLKEIFEALQSKSDFKQYLVDNLGFSAEHAGMIAEMRVESLKRASQDDLRAKISVLEKEQEAVRESLKDIDAVMIEQVEQLLVWAKKNHPEFLARMTQVEW